MITIERQRLGITSRKVFEVLLSHPDGMNTYSLVRSLEGSLPESLHWTGPITKHSLETMVQLGISAPAQAGWISNHDGLWSVSAAGRKAYASNDNPERFLNEAAKLSIKGWLSITFPKLYLAASRLRYQIAVEKGLVKRLGIKRLLKTAVAGRLAARSDWKNVLPMQPVRMVAFHTSKPAYDAMSLAAQLRAEGMEPSELEGTDYLYIAPDQEWRGRLGERVTCPENTALIVRRDSTVAIEPIRTKARGDDLPLRANLLFQTGLAARVFDTFILKIGNNHYRAYAAEHVEGTSPTAAHLDAALATFKGLCPTEALRPLIKTQAGAFPTPSAVVRPDGRLAFRTFDEFKLGRYGKFLKSVALNASDASHWGDRSIIRGWKYLYQRVPGVPLPARRDCARRLDAIESLMKAAGVSIKGRLVLDVGMNMGMMMAQYLARGAAWCHGWDLATLSEHAERLLLSLGCTSFSITGCDLSKMHDIESDVPSFVKPMIGGCVISYLAVRGPLGWLDSLARIPWSFMIYEGHEEETERDLERFVSEFNEMVPVRIAAVGQVQDGDSEPRTLAILTRQTPEASTD
ncbi:MAG TPA: hypothetical protein VEZ90_11220 [Blastocatellia bacterium]|nr:hypothetical protein [Blastocatellia bacterium]